MTVVDSISSDFRALKSFKEIIWWRFAVLLILSDYRRFIVILTVFSQGFPKRSHLGLSAVVGERAIIS
jgi:hypothetical protein